MEKILVKKYYLITFVLFIILCIFNGLTNFNKMYLIFSTIIFILIFAFLKFIHDNAHKKIKENFLKRKFAEEMLNKEILSEKELDKIYNEEYDKYFKN